MAGFQVAKYDMRPTQAVVPDASTPQCPLRNTHLRVVLEGSDDSFPLSGIRERAPAARRAERIPGQGRILGRSAIAVGVTRRLRLGGCRQRCALHARPTGGSGARGHRTDTRGARVRAHPESRRNLRHARRDRRHQRTRKAKHGNQTPIRTLPMRAIQGRKLSP